MRDESLNVDESAGLVPLQAAIGDAQLNSAVFIRQTGILSSIAGLLGPDILISVAANSITYSPAANTITFGLASTASTAIFNATTEFQKSGTKVVGARGAAVADAASPDATDLATALTLVNELKAQVNTLLARLRAATGHGLIS